MKWNFNIGDVCCGFREFGIILMAHLPQFKSLASRTPVRLVRCKFWNDHRILDYLMKLLWTTARLSEGLVQILVEFELLGSLFTGRLQEPVLLIRRTLIDCLLAVRLAHRPVPRFLLRSTHRPNGGLGLVEDRFFLVGGCAGQLVGDDWDSLLSHLWDDLLSGSCEEHLQLVEDGIEVMVGSGLRLFHFFIFRRHQVETRHLLDCEVVVARSRVLHCWLAPRMHLCEGGVIFLLIRRVLPFVLGAGVSRVE